MGDLWLVGEAPARGYDYMPAFSSRSGEFLADLLGLEPVQNGEGLRKAFRCVNLLDRWPGNQTIGELKNSKGAAFPLWEARPRATKFARKTFQPGDRVILAGSRVAEAFRVRPQLGLFSWGNLYVHTLMTLNVATADVELSVIPHPSGVNRQWNDREIRLKAFRHLSAAIVQSREFTDTRSDRKLVGD